MGVRPPYLEVTAELAKLTYVWNNMFTIYFNSKCLVAVTFRNTDIHTHREREKQRDREIETETKQRQTQTER